MIRISRRDLEINERREMLADYEHILQKAGVPQRDMKRYAFVAEEDGLTIGYISGVTDHLWLYLSDLWVDESRRCKGIGALLVKELENRLIEDGIEHIYLWTYGPDNQRFYERNGFIQFAVFEGFYEVEGYNQIGFRKDLKQP